jgi:hypothetical protein
MTINPTLRATQVLSLDDPGRFAQAKALLVFDLAGSSAALPFTSSKSSVPPCSLPDTSRVCIAISTVNNGREAAIQHEEMEDGRGRFGREQ